ncbi:MAG: capsular exopolysaccharide family [Akkermansiaceae bacterium]|nr:capsular exopolysaccharide family [Akkermansiaceae bacterium]
MNSSNNASEASLHAVDYWQVIKNRYGVILLTFLLTFMSALVLTYVMPKKYESRAVVQVQSSEQRYRVDPTANNRSGENQTIFLATEFEVIKSQKTLDEAIVKLQLVDHWNTDLESVRRRLRGIVDAEGIRGTSLIAIRVRCNDAKDAKAIAEQVADSYARRRNQLVDDANSQVIDELRKAVKTQEDIVEDKRQALQTIIRTQGIIYSNSARGSGQPGGFSESQTAEMAAKAYVETEQSRIQLESQIETLLQYDGTQLIAYAAGLDLPDNLVKTLYPQYLEEKRKLEAMMSMGGLGERHPSVIAERGVIEQMQKDLDAAVGNLRGVLKAKLDLAKETLKRMSVRKDTTKADAVKSGIADSSFDDANDDFRRQTEMLQKLKLQSITEGIQKTITQQPTIIHEAPTESTIPVSPNIVVNLAVGGVLGLVFGLGVAFFLEYLDTSVKSLEDVERYLQVPVLAVIPKDVGVLYKQSGMSPDAEAYRILRTNIEFNRKNPEDNAITVVSGGAGEGKSTTLVNLAYICAQGGYTTLMIDADLRRPRLHTFFDINNSVGLTNYLTTELMLEDVILQTPVDNLYFMPSGILPADAAGILNSRRMSELIQDVKQRFDLVLVDSPPILGVSDASVLASEVDLTMIVVQHRKLPRNMLLRVKQAVENVGGHVIGVVLNNVDVRSDSQYQYYTSYYTYYAPAESQVGPPTTSPAAGKATKPAPRGSKGDSKQDLY